MIRNNKLPLLIGVGVLVIIGVFIAFKATSQPSQHSMGQSGNSADMNMDHSVMTDAVTISGYAYSPENITVKKGTTVTWTNQDTVKHTVTSDDKAAGLDSKLLAKGESYSHTFDKAGTFDYYCKPHPYMKATVIVTE